MENTPFSSHLWMSRYGLLQRNGSSFLGARPLRILQPDASIPTQLPTPSWLNASAYNPSLAAVPPSLQTELRCPRCAYVATLRVDWATGCTGELLKRLRRKIATNPLGLRKRTLVLLVDARFGLVASGWLQDAEPAAWARDTPPPPLHDRRRLDAAASVYDARLHVSPDAQLWLAGLRAGPKGTEDVTGLAPLHLRRRGTTLAAWQRPAEILTVTRGSKCAGRSFAFLSGDDDAARAGELRYFSWLAPTAVVCALPPPPIAGGARPQPRVAFDNDDGRLERLLDELRGRGSCRVQAHTRMKQPREASAKRCRLSLNGVLLRVPEWGGALLGVGHLHRGHREWLDGAKVNGGPNGVTFGGHHYTHFWFKAAAAPPHELLAVSSEFCLGAARAGGPDCEAVQYLAGLARAPGSDRLLLSFGVNDCSHRLLATDLGAVGDDLRPL